VQTIGTLGAAAKGGLAARRIFFGHQSVGRNIIAGVAEVLAANTDLRMNMLTVDQVPPADSPFFAHANISTNGQPMLKTDEFARRIEEGLGDQVDIAFHKYCYVDVLDATDVGGLFEHYRKEMARLRAKYPKVVFVHVTVPLTTVQAGRRGALKKLLGIAPDGYQDNFRREEFNRLMRREYAGREPVFDLAAVEATDREGRQLAIALNGKTGMALLDEYTIDGGHLNESGRRRVAEELLVMLARLPSLDGSGPANATK
jgi:hypothetical protein